MASISMDQEQETRRGGKPPVSAHPAFPAIVALWFAALLGLGSLILPVQLLERIVTATGIQGIVSAAAPPLGFTARAAIALVATVLGAVLGIVAARRVARSPRGGEVTQTGRFGRGPLNASEDLGDEGLDADHSDDADNDEEMAEDPEDVDAYEDVQAEDAGPKRRRALAMSEEDEPSEFLAVAPLPGSDGETVDIDDVVDDETLDLGAEAELAEDFDNEPRQEFVVPEAAEAPTGITHVEKTVEDSESAPFAAPGDSAATAEPLHFSPPSMARQDDDDADPRPFDVPQETQTTAPDFGEAEPQEDTVSDKQIFEPQPEAGPLRVSEDQPEVPEAYSPDEDEAQTGATVEDASPAESEGPGLVQLVQQLGSTLEKHREWSAQRAASAPAAPLFEEAGEDASDDAAAPIPQDFDPARPDDAAEAMAAYFGKPADADADELAEDVQDENANPAPVAGEGYAPFGGNFRLSDLVDAEDDDDEIADLSSSFSLPIARNVEPTPPTVTPTPRPSFDIVADDTVEERGDAIVEEEAESEQAPAQRDADYGSLASISNPFRQDGEDFVRIDEPEPDADSAQPAVIFPNEEAERAAPIPVPSEETEDEAPAKVARPFDRPADAPASTEQRAAASNDDNERALREALMNLQRMGK